MNTTPIKVLVCEDDVYQANALRVKLTKSGYDVTISADGQQAMELLKSTTPDIIVLDLLMPKKDGFSVLSELKASDTTKHIPVIIASNLGQKEDIQKGLAMGADAYLVKSAINLDEFVQKIEAICAARRS